MRQRPHRYVLIVAGSDPSGGAGLQADLQTVSALRTAGGAVATALTVQNTAGVREVLPLPPDFVVKQLEAVLEDIPVSAIKVGMLGSLETGLAIGEVLRRYPAIPVVIDPVLSSKNERLLLDRSDKRVADGLWSRSILVTPNIPEAQQFLGESFDRGNCDAFLRRLHAFCKAPVLLKGGHDVGDEAVDWLFDGKEITAFAGSRQQAEAVHGTGCFLSTAIATLLAHGLPLKDSVRTSKNAISEAILGAQKIGSGYRIIDFPNSLRSALRHIESEAYHHGSPSGKERSH